MQKKDLKIDSMQVSTCEMQFISSVSETDADAVRQMRQTDRQMSRQTDRQGSESDETGSLSFPITGSGSASDPFVGANICSLVLTSRINCGSNETRSLPTAAIQPAALADK